jgi:hypothetical protein
MRMTYFKVMVEHDGYPHIEQDGLTLDEAHEYMERMQRFYPDSNWWIERMQRFYPDSNWWIDEGNAPSEQYENFRTYARGTADGWEDFFSTDEG